MVGQPRKRNTESGEKPGESVTVKPRKGMSQIRGQAILLRPELEAAGCLWKF